MSASTPRGELLRCRVDHGVDFVVVGGEAAVVHGSATVTQDLDVVARMEPDNLARLLAALDGLAPAFVTRPDLPFDRGPEELAGWRTLLIRTALGRLDVLRSVTPGGTWAELDTVEVDLAGRRCRVLSLDALIEVKAATGRPKDRLVEQELRALRALRDETC